MTDLTSLYAAAERCGLTVLEVPMTELKAISTPDGCIGLNPTRLADSAEEKACLAHEMGHCVTGSFYSLGTPLLMRTRAEQRAIRWSIRRLVPLRELHGLLREGLRPDELAEHFGVPEELIGQAVAYYRDACGLL